MVSIRIKKPYTSLISRSCIYDTTSKALNYMVGDNSYEVSILIGDDALLHELNQQYLGIDKPTDVLSFESHEIDPETGLENLGDILISYDSAKKQALQADHGIDDEVKVLLVHGILHLLGYDHDTKEQKEEMWKKQNELIEFLGIKINYLSGDENFHD